MAMLTITPDREAQVDFTEPWISGVDEIVVTSPTAPALASLDDLSGRNVFVRQSSGDARLDQKAEQYARALTFRPGSHRDWVIITFRWGGAQP